MSVKPQQIFEYLLAIKNMTSPPMRDFRDYEYYRYLEELPQGEGCYLLGEGNDTDAWIEVHKQQISPPPRPAKMLEAWITNGFRDETVVPEVYEEKKLPPAQTDYHEEPTQTEKFTDDIERARLFDDWLDIWKGWAEDTKRKKQIQEFYGFLFALVQRIEREGESIELGFGHGLLSWKHPQGDVMHPILITHAELTFDAGKGIFCLKPNQRGTVLETEMLTGLEIPNHAHLHKMKQSIGEAGIDPRHIESVAGFYKELVQTLDPDGEYGKKLDKVTLSSTPYITEKPVLFIRNRSAQLWKEELSQIIEYLNNNGQAPKTIQALLQIEPLLQNESEKREWNAIGEDLLFPLPANEDQKEIARRLAGNFGITVQGPPGTGKSHTIANLISHLLAHGKKVLVTSHTERALKVLADKIPEEIRSLCVPVLGGDARSLQVIEDAVRSISDKMEYYDVEMLNKEIEIFQQHLIGTRNNIAQLKEKLRQAASASHQTVDWKGKELSAIDAAKKLHEEQAHNWLPDAIGLQASFPLSDKEFNRLWELRGELQAKDSSIVEQYLPDEEKVLSPQTVREFFVEGENLERQVADAQHHITRYSIPLEENFLAEAAEHVEAIIAENEILDTAYLSQIIMDVTAGGEREKTWVDLTTDASNEVNEISMLTRRLAEYEITLPDKELHEIKQDLYVIKERLAKRKLGKLYLMTSGRKVKYLAEFGVINGKHIENLQEAEVVQSFIKLTEKKERLIRKWNATIQEVNGPVFKQEEGRLTARLDEAVGHIKKAVGLAYKIMKAQKVMQRLRPPSGFSFYSSEQLHDLAHALEEAKWAVKKELWDKSFAQHEANLDTLLSRDRAHSNCQHLLEVFRSRDIDGWAEAYEIMGRVHELRDKHRAFNELLDKIQLAAPNWASHIRTTMASAVDFPTDWKQAWEWSQLNTWLTILNSEGPEKMEEKLQAEQKHERKLIEQIVAKSTWKKQIERTTEPQKRALQAWKQKIKRIGKGTGKYADKFRKEAREEMDQCRPAIPVWIMPIHRVIENLSISDDKFDVVIVDESSQCDLFALSALLRAEKAVIVGDDEQISPSAVGVHQEEVRSLISRYLVDVPQANSLDMQTSLYDIAARVFPGKLMLKEHFRCVPEIIQFSNDLSYGGEIIPLRLPTLKEKIEPAVVTKRVIGYRSEGTRIFNEAEAEEIVKDVKEMVADPAFEGRTIGVISLQGQHQAQLIESRLREEIGEEEIVKRKLICGDSYDFQGDERDVIFLSLIVANNVRFMPLTKKDAQQRFNVAASRAQNQLRLYHSVDLSELNPEDMRYRLLAYCLNPSRVMERVEEAEKLCDSQFEIDVLRMITAKGYQVRPQVQVGRFRIDLVIEGVKNRLAVECDGDRWHGIDKWEEDRERQRILERAGWIFWRVRGSKFYLDQKKAMEDLWIKLDEMGIDHEAVS
ncbi:AAA domain-containing protein [Aneurinibacillus sp. Ricciae_BoGa-3]|uniref:AAA domain-containing protein n=1 Tax=Aneurinibacillus sp. Ricciae_BoGa-3 TaxID=3022697 RepID=UPI0023406D3E|nr:AAA domain-containing protein [Aneurinibacillus sp. Ricciae_BoGa-3]WCK54014.1 AAA domain-containing protein [Aneurinibacillus sp. Ricciae_BoGa-3]